MASKIVFNGQEYPSVDAMPPDARRAYLQVMGMFADKDGDGVPDLFQGASSDNVVVQQSSLVVNGKAYPSVDAMPADVRRLYESALIELEKLDGAVAGEAEVSFSATTDDAPAPPAAEAPVVTGSRTLRARGVSGGPRWGEEVTPGGVPRVLLLGLVVALVLAVIWALTR